MPSASRREVFESQTTIAGGGSPSGRRWKASSGSRASGHDPPCRRGRELVEQARGDPDELVFRPPRASWPAPSVAVVELADRPATPAASRNIANAAWRLAELDSPAPSGTSPASAARTPRSGPSDSPLAHVTPRT